MTVGRFCLTLCLICLPVPCSILFAQSASHDSSQTSATLDPGETSNGFYRNRFFGFSYRIRYGWLDRTDEMRDVSTDPAKSTVLLSLFERPPLARGSDVNSAIVIAAESISSYPGLKNAAQYFGPISEATEAKGMKPVNDAYEFPVDGKPIYRRDFTKDISGVAMHQSTLAMLSRGYVLSFTFIGSSDEEVQQLIEFLRFGTPAKTATNSPKASK
ncbi:MAG: hypothetical protein JOZ80_20350 [Acidobacteriaceae bacterium]|nr:hypothetical protein [Acidobacteriaceae bacterium]